MRQNYLVLCLLLCANLHIDTASAGKAIKAIKFLKGGVILAALLPHLFPFPLPIPIPIDNQHHDYMPVCDAKPVHIYKHYEFIPYPVRVGNNNGIRGGDGVMDNMRNVNNMNNMNNMVNNANRRPMPIRNDQLPDGNDVNPDQNEDNSQEESVVY